MISLFICHIMIESVKNFSWTICLYEGESEVTHLLTPRGSVPDCPPSLVSPPIAQQSPWLSVCMCGGGGVYVCYSAARAEKVREEPAKPLGGKMTLGGGEGGNLGRSVWVYVCVYVCVKLS
jgi:hypothetical protein